MRVFLLLLCAAFLSSCALNYVPQVGGTTFITDEPMTAVVGPDTLRMERDELNFIPLKRGEDTEMILIRNLKTDTIVLRTPSTTCAFA